MKLSIIIPAYNEQKTIEDILQKVSRVKFKDIDTEIIVVDDGSSDETFSIANSFKSKIKKIVIIRHPKNKGKGAAIATGAMKATGDYIIIQDADLEYDPNQIPKLIEPIIKARTQVVYGTRLKRFPNPFKEAGQMGRMLFLLHFFGNRSLSFFTSILYGQWLTDMETCYKVFPKKFVEETNLQARGFDFEPEVTAKLLKKGYKILEIPITTTPRGYEEGKKLRTIPDGILAVKTLLKYRFVN